MAGESTALVSLEPVRPVSTALCKGGGLQGCLVECYVEEWPGPASERRVSRELAEGGDRLCLLRLLECSCGDRTLCLQAMVWKLWWLDTVISASHATETVLS